MDRYQIQAAGFSALARAIEALRAEDWGDRGHPKRAEVMRQFDVARESVLMSLRNTIKQMEYNSQRRAAKG